MPRAGAAAAADDAIEQGKVASLRTLYLHAVPGGGEGLCESPLAAALWNSMDRTRSSYTGAVQLLLQLGADVTAPCALRFQDDDSKPFYEATHGRPTIFYPLHMACCPLTGLGEEDGPDVGPAVTKHIQLLLAAGADINAKAHPFNETPLHTALARCLPLAINPATKAVPLQLIAAGADVNAVQLGGQFRPIDIATWSNNVPAFKALLDAGADPRPRPYAAVAQSLDDVMQAPVQTSSHYLEEAVQQDRHEIVAAAIGAGVKAWQVPTQGRGSPIPMVAYAMLPYILAVNSVKAMLSGGGTDVVKEIHPAATIAHILKEGHQQQGHNNEPGTLLDVATRMPSTLQLNAAQRAKLQAIKAALLQAGAKTAAQLAEEAEGA